MECNRRGCDKIMCDRYSSTFGYICDECFEQLQLCGMPIDMFMSTDKRLWPKYNYEEEFPLPDYED